MSEIKVKQQGTEMQISVPVPGMKYLNQCMRANCFEELHDLFRHAHAPAKEFTESYAALEHLRPHFCTSPSKMNYVLHVGDGAHCRTGALFAFMAKNTINVSIDPKIQYHKVDDWVRKWDVKRFHRYQGRAEDLVEFLPNFFQMPPQRTFVTFVHSHVNTDEILNMFRWKNAYVNPCCQAGNQLSQSEDVCKSGEDYCILSPERKFQVLHRFF